MERVLCKTRLRHRRPQRDGVPRVQYIYLDLLGSGLDCGDFVVGDRIPDVIIADLTNVALADE